MAKVVAVDFTKVGAGADYADDGDPQLRGRHGIIMATATGSRFD